jgi:hypothetical protein
MMITKETLQMFCATESGHKLSNPFNVGAYTYATNGHFGIRVPAMPEFAGNAGPDKIEAVWFHGMVVDDLWVPVASVVDKRTMKQCPVCDGSGQISKCPECDGNGVVEWTSDNDYDYEAECKMCDGDGTIGGNGMVCSTCLGQGKIATTQRINVGSKLLNANLLSIMNQLPNCQIATEAVEGYECIPFRFDGGDGIIMPCRME